MGYRSIVTSGLGALTALLLVTSLGAIALLNRMTPAIEQIIEENVASLDAVEEILSILARRLESPGDEERRRVEAATRRLRGNITEDEEAPAVADLEASAQAAIDGDEGARARTVDALLELGEINRQAMLRADRRAQRLGVAGAWAVALLALVGFTLSWIVLLRLRAYLLDPIDELLDTLEAYSRGERLRRCSKEEAPPEIGRAMEVVNALLDRAGRAAPRGAEPAPPGGAERALVLALLDDRPEAMVVADDAGEIVATNARGLSALEQDHGGELRRALSTLGEAAEPPRWCRPVRDAALWLCALPDSEEA